MIATSLGELAAFSVPTAVWGLTAIAGLSNGAAYLPVVPWWRNLSADADVTVQDRRPRLARGAVSVEGEERRQLWQRMCARNRQLASLERKAGLEFALVRLVSLESR